MYGLSMGDMSFDDCTITNITSGVSGSFIESMQSLLQFDISQCTFSCSSTNSSYTYSSL